jgi:hypothetical protein
VDLTRYVEQHSFTFDEAFDGNSSNVDVRSLKKDENEKKHP